MCVTTNLNEFRRIYHIQSGRNAGRKLVLRKLSIVYVIYFARHIEGRDCQCRMHPKAKTCRRLGNVISCVLVCAPQKASWPRQHQTLLSLACTDCFEILC
jgi:hypothetical protein